MPYDAQHYPATVYPDEIVRECPEARPVIDVLIRRMREVGTQPDGYQVKNLGKRHGGLWQANLKVQKRQVRLLYAPYGAEIVIFRIHKKGSPQEQERAYALARTRKRDFETQRAGGSRSQNDPHRTIH